MIVRKKPVEVEARVFDHSPASCAEIIEWAAQYGVEIVAEYDGKESQQLRIPTLEGDHIASPGDYIIKGVRDEFYPCKPDVFRLTYELVG